jgi:hypothetical protein
VLGYQGTIMSLQAQASFMIGLICQSKQSSWHASDHESVQLTIMPAGHLAAQPTQLLIAILAVNAELSQFGHGRTIGRGTSCEQAGQYQR